jgi:glutathione S-transferase
VLEKTAGFFPALSAFLKNKDASLDETMGSVVEAQLDILDEVIRSSPGQYVCGIEMTLADLYLAPQLFHATVAMDHFKQVRRT